MATDLPDAVVRTLELVPAISPGKEEEHRPKIPAETEMNISTREENGESAVRERAAQVERDSIELEHGDSRSRDDILTRFDCQSTVTEMKTG